MNNTIEPTPQINIRNVFFAYQKNAVLENINLNVYPKDYIAIIGPNGGGKTTLFKLILGILKPKSGEIKVLGQKPCKTSYYIGYVPQNHHISSLFPISAMDIVLMGSLSSRKKMFYSLKKNRRKAIEILDRLKMADFANNNMNSLSGGQRQKIFIARALMTTPKILLLDEPTTGIDSKGQTELYGLLEELNKDITIVMVSHDMMILSSHVKSVACVNRNLYYHDQSEISEQMIKSIYPDALTAECPIELIAHGMPHRVLKHHHKIGLKND